MKVPMTYKELFFRKDSLTAEDGLCEFSSSSLASLVVRLFYFFILQYICKKYLENKPFQVNTR